MALVNINEGLKEEYSMNKTFSAEYDFSCVRQIARADRFARMLTRAITRVKRKGLVICSFWHKMWAVRVILQCGNLFIFCDHFFCASVLRKALCSRLLFSSLIIRATHHSLTNVVNTFIHWFNFGLVTLLLHNCNTKTVFTVVKKLLKE